MNDYYDYTDFTYPATDTTTNLDPATAAGIAVLFVFMYLLILAAIYVVSAIFLGKVFKKAGVPSWIAWVPFYNSWKVLEIGGQQGFWAVLAILPIVSIVSAVFHIIAMYHIGLKLGKSGAFVVLGIFLPFVWLIWLAVDTSKWNDKAAGAAPSLHRPTPTAHQA